MKDKLAAFLMAGLVLICSGCATGRKAIPIGKTTSTPSIWPVKDETATISSKFGLRGQGAAVRHHNGVDIPAPKGTPVVATANGYVLFRGRAGSYGRAIKIGHADGIETCYAHLRKCIAKKGKPVEQGEVIGKVGKSGKADGYHLHYEVRAYGTPVDPARFLPPRVAPQQQEPQQTIEKP